jgi:uncharacterized protein (DUF2225 family)
MVMHQHSNLKVACSYLIIEKTDFQQTYNLQAFLFPEKALFNMITRVSVSTMDYMYLLISNFRRFLNVVCFLLGDSLASVV